MIRKGGLLDGTTTEKSTINEQTGANTLTFFILFQMCKCNNKNMHGAYTGTQFVTFKLVQKTCNTITKTKTKTTLKKNAPGPAAPRASGARGLPRH